MNNENCDCQCNEYSDLDFYQLMIPVANMILWNYGLRLIGNEYNNLTLVLNDNHRFKHSLINELKKFEE